MVITKSQFLVMGIVRRLFDCRGAADEVTALKMELNQRAYGLFWLSDEEVRMIEGLRMKNNKTLAPLFCFLMILTGISCGIFQPSSGNPSTQPPVQEPVENIPTDVPQAPNNPPTDSAGNFPAENSTVAIPNALQNNFSLDNANLVPPNDILNEIIFYGGGGEPMCGFKPAVPSPRSNDGQVDQDLMTLYTLTVCGWQKDEVVTGTVTYPNGQIITQTLQLELEPFHSDGNVINGVYYSRLGFKPTLNDPAGAYLYKMEGSSGTVQFSVNFHKPQGPHLFIADTRKILFYGFSPKEKVKLLYYQADDKKGAHFNLKGWQEYSMNSSGQLYVFTNVELMQNGYFVALGKGKSETWLPTENNTPGTSRYPQQASSKVNEHFCPGKRSRLTIFMTAKVTYTDGKNMLIHSSAGLSKNVIDRIPEGTEIFILEGPQCADKLTWWNVRHSDNSKGWVAEASPEGAYLLEP